MKKYNIIYEPKGMALEYSPLAINIYEGCEHGCKYCYVPACRFKKREEFYGHQEHRADVLAKLEKDLCLMKANNDKRRVLFCFTCDPYQKDDEFNMLTRSCLQLFNKHDVNFQILTKGGTKAVRDFDLYKQGDAFACTLTFWNEQKSLEWEPKAMLPSDRIKALEIAKANNIETWASFEPVIDPKETFELIDRTKDFVDLYKIGKINRFKTGIEVDWRKFTVFTMNYLDKLGKKYYIKDSLKQYLK